MCEPILLIEKKNGEEIGKSVLSEITTVSQREFFEASQNGFKPELVVKIWDTEYSGERLLECKGMRYSIYRNAKDDRFRYLYCEERIGTR